MKRYKTVDDFMASVPEGYKSTLETLRRLLNESEMDETVKWGMPTYTVNNKNVAGMGYFKSYCGLWFFQGVFLSDPGKVLVNAQEGTTQGMRQWRFTGNEKMDEDLVRVYLQEAIDNQKAGKEIKPQKKPLVIPSELQSAFEEDHILQETFNSMGLTKRREYADYISSAKREETRKNRLQKIIPMILKGIGLNDKYR